MLSIVFLFFILVIAAIVAVVVSLCRKPKLTSDVTFERVEYMDGSKLENFYDSPIDNPSWDDAEELKERFKVFHRYGYVDDLGKFTPVNFFRN